MGISQVQPPARLFPFMLLATFIGCNGAGGPSVHYVEGVVTLDGQPIEGVLVNFSPAGSGTAAAGTTDANGVFKLTAMPNGGVDGGAEAGEYNVGFMKAVGSTASAEMTSEDPNYETHGIGAGGQTQLAKVEHVVPVNYNNPATSGFKVTVKPGKNTGDDFKFELTSK